MYWEDFSPARGHDSPHWATSDRGWFYIGTATFGFYLDYGPDHHRSGHEYCGDGPCYCRLEQPGSILASRYHRDKGGRCYAQESRYFETVGDAKTWIEAYNADSYS